MAVSFSETGSTGREVDSQNGQGEECFPFGRAEFGTSNAWRQICQ